MTRAAGRLRVGYVLKMFPRFSETFVMNEILELERQGADVVVFSILPPVEGRFHSRVSELRAEIRYLPAFKDSEFWSRIRQSQTWLREHREGYARALWHALECHSDAGLKYFMRAATIAEMSRDLNLDHLHAHFANDPAQVAMYASLMTGIRFSLTAHAKDIYHKDVDLNLLGDIVKNSAFLVTVSRFNRDYLRRKLPRTSWPKICHVYNGIDLDFFMLRTAGRKANVILSVGRLVEKKGFRYLIEAMGILTKQGFNLRCEIIGEGEERLALNALISQLKLSRTVKLLGGLPQDKVRRHMQEAAAFVLPAVIADDGNRDALPTVLLEAMATGLPVISTDVVGIPEILEKGKCGLLVAQRDSEALADAMGTLLRNAGLRKRLARLGRDKVEKDFDIRRNVRSLHRLLKLSIRKARERKSRGPRRAG